MSNPQNQVTRQVEIDRPPTKGVLSPLRIVGGAITNFNSPSTMPKSEPESEQGLHAHEVIAAGIAEDPGAVKFKVRASEVINESPAPVKNS